MVDPVSDARQGDVGWGGVDAARKFGLCAPTLGLTQWCLWAGQCMGRALSRPVSLCARCPGRRELAGNDKVGSPAVSVGVIMRIGDSVAVGSSRRG